MMESLAADLPQQNNSNLKRSYTVQHRRNLVSKEDGKKPPLPKLSTPVNLNSSQSVKQVLNSRITSGSSPNLPLHSSPRLTRPKELFVRQITLPMDCYEVEETPIVPSPSLATPTQAKTVIPPPIPARRYPRVYQHQVNSHSSNTDESEPERLRRGSESSPKNFRSNESSPNNFRSNDSGILTSPSPPTDSGIALSPPTQTRLVTKPPDEFADKNSKNSAVDTVSLSSSESDTTSGSRYDNVSVSTPKHLQNNRRFSNDTTGGGTSSSTSKTSTLVAAAAEIAARKLNSPTREISTQTLEDGIDGDDEDEETSDSSSDILVLDSSSSNHEHEILEDDIEDLEDEELDCEVSKNHDEIEISDHFRRRGNSHRRLKFKPSVQHQHQSNRDSVSPYDNFTLPGAVSNSSSSVISSRNSPSHTEGQNPAGFQKLLAAGPTSNV